ncbi:hypothetical protein Tco_0549334 [Tanacetum coccineum]
MFAHITGSDIANMILDQSFDQLYDDNVVSLCCLGILQLVILGVESRRVIPDWMLRLSNDRVAWDKYPWGSYVWPTLYSQLRNANVKRWSPLYVAELTNEDDVKTYSIFGYTWAFKEMNVQPVRQENKEPIIVEQHYGLSDFSQFQSMQGGPSSFQGHVNSSYFNMGTLPNFQTPMLSQPGSSVWQRQMPVQSATQYWQPSTSSHHGHMISRGLELLIKEEECIMPIWTVLYPIDLSESHVKLYPEQSREQDLMIETTCSSFPSLRKLSMSPKHPVTVTDIFEKDKIEAKNDKTKHETEKSVQEPGN